MALFAANNRRSNLLVVALALFVSSLYPGSFSCLAAEDAARKSEALSSDEVKRLIESVGLKTGSYKIVIQQQYGLEGKALQPGTKARIPLELFVEGLDAGYDIYAIVLMELGDQEIITERVSTDQWRRQTDVRSLQMSFGDLNYRSYGTVNSRTGAPMIQLGMLKIEQAEFTVAGPLGSGMQSLLAISNSNFPVHLNIPASLFGELLLSMTNAKDKETALKDFNVKNEKFPLTLNMAYLASTGESNAEAIKDLSLTISLPTSPVYYDGVLIAPIVVKRFPNDFTVAYYNDRNSNRLNIPVTPPVGVKRPPDSPRKTAAQSKPIESAGSLNIDLLDKYALQVGRPSSVRFKIDYDGLAPMTQIFVMLQVMNGNKVIVQRNGTLVTQEIGKMNMRMCDDPDLAKGPLRIQNTSISANTPLLGQLEAGLISPDFVKGSGSVSGSIAFTPPPFNVYYDRVRATPIAVTWQSDGRRCTIVNLGDKSSVDIGLAGR